MNLHLQYLFVDETHFFSNSSAMPFVIAGEDAADEM